MQFILESIARRKKQKRTYPKTENAGKGWKTPMAPPTKTTIFVDEKENIITSEHKTPKIEKKFEHEKQNNPIPSLVHSFFFLRWSVWAGSTVFWRT